MNYFVNNTIGDDINGNGTENMPYKTLEHLIYKINNYDNEIRIHLSSGDYYFSYNIFKFCNCKVLIFGKNNKTILHQTSGWYSNSCGGYNSLTLEFYNLIYKINLNLTQPNLNFIYSNLNFYNVVFDEIPDNGYSLFLPNGSVFNFYNCTKTRKTNNFFRCTLGKINVYNSYGAFTSGFATNNEDWNKCSNILVDEPKLDKVFKIINDSNTTGVYSGKYRWNDSIYLIEDDNNKFKMSINKDNKIILLNSSDFNDYNIWINSIQKINNVLKELYSYNIIKLKR